MAKDASIVSSLQRRDIIKSRSEAMAQAKTYATYWLTRNSIQGYLSDAVDVWLERPIRTMYDGDVMWIPVTPATESYWGRWTLDQAYIQVRAGVPDNDRECLRVG